MYIFIEKCVSVDTILVVRFISFDVLLFCEIHTVMKTNDPNLSDK